MHPAFKDLAAWVFAVATAHFYYAGEHGTALLSCMAAAYWWIDYARSRNAIRAAMGLN